MCAWTAAGFGRTFFSHERRTLAIKKQLRQTTATALLRLLDFISAVDPDDTTRETKRQLTSRVNYLFLLLDIGIEPGGQAGSIKNK